MPEPPSISHEGIELGRWIYSAWKHLRGYAASILTSFEATSLAGKCCDLLGRMRQLQPYSLSMIEPLARDCGITRRELRDSIVPILDSLGILQVERRGSTIHSVRAIVLSQSDVMDQVSRVWGTLGPDASEQGCLILLRRTAALPLTRDEALHACVQTSLTDAEAAEALELALAVDLVRQIHTADYGIDFVYNDFLWGEDVERTAKALASLKPQMREGLAALLDELHSHEGRPTPEIESADPNLVKLAIAQGLVEAVEIKTAEGRTATFHFTPRFRGFGISRDDVPDVLDQVKLVIASFAFSTRYARYKLRDPEGFLERLVEDEVAGNATPIGTDYGSLERQKIVEVEPVTPNSNRYRFRTVKRDALVEALDTMRAGALLVPRAGGAQAGMLREPYAFTDPVATRQHARRSGDRPLYDASLLAAIRDAAHRDQF